MQPSVRKLLLDILTQQQETQRIFSSLLEGSTVLIVNTGEVLRMGEGGFGCEGDRGEGALARFFQATKDDRFEWGLIYSSSGKFDIFLEGG